MKDKFREKLKAEGFLTEGEELKLPPFIVKEKDIERMWLRRKIMKVVEEHQIRLTPTEYEELVTDYINKFYYNVSIVDIIQISDNIKRRHSAGYSSK